MTMSPDYTQYYDEIFDIIDGLKSMVIYGVHKNVVRHLMPERYKYAHDFKHYFQLNGFEEVDTLDLFDAEADLRFDLNSPAPESHVCKYDVVMDIGTMEHVFDIKQVLDTSFSMVKVGGYYVLHTVANGLMTHGYYAIHPEVIRDALLANGFEVTYLKMSTCGEEGAEEVDINGDYHQPMVLWCVAKKTKHIPFVNPQQQNWAEEYK